MFKTGPLFDANYNSKADVVINQGGTDSGKTREIMHVLSFIAATHPAPPEDPIITIFSASIPDAKKGAYRVFEFLYGSNEYLRSRIIHWDRGGRVVTFSTGWIMEFRGHTDEQSAKQGKRQYLFVNEANGIPWLAFWQMAKRTRTRVFIDYNPTAPFWAHEKLIGTVPSGNDLYAVVQLIISDHRHNPFLSQKDHDKTENIRDPELWKVYARGLTGKLTGQIYTNWQMIDKWPEEGGTRIGGLDFGYTNDPTAGVRIRVMKSRVFVDELCYTPGLSNMKIYEMYRKEYKFKTETPVYCDRDLAELRELRLKGMLALPTYDKSSGSVTRGIHKLKMDYEIFYTARSKNLAEELKSYMWVMDPDTNLPTNEPVGHSNHLMDAIRYGLTSYAARKAS